MNRPLIVLTGASGRLGVSTHRALLDAGFTVRATDRTASRLDDQPIHRANLNSRASCRRVLEGADVLVHLAYRREPLGYPRGYPHRAFDNQLRLNRTVFVAACEAGVRQFIFPSSIQVIARQGPKLSASELPPYLPLDNDSPAAPDNWYSLGKLCSEEMLAMLRRQFGIHYTVLRLPSLFNTVPSPTGPVFKGRLSEAFSYLTIRDAANLIATVVAAAPVGARTYIPASARNGLGQSPAQVLRDHYSGVRLLKPAPEIEGLVDISSLKRDFGWVPSDLNQPDVPPYMHWLWRQYRRSSWRIPESLRPKVEGWLALIY